MLYQLYLSITSLYVFLFHLRVSSAQLCVRKESQLIFHFNSHNLFTIIGKHILYIFLGTRVEIRVISAVRGGLVEEGVAGSG